MWKALILLGLIACDVSKTLPDDPAPTITIGFDKPDSMADEKSMAHKITIKLSDRSPIDVDVTYAVLDTGTAKPFDDFNTKSAETMTIPAGQLSIDLEIEVKGDTDATEVNETIDLYLANAEGAILPAGARNHQVLILAKALPRVRFLSSGVMMEEPMDSATMIELDEESEFPITADYTVTSANAEAGTDYVLANGQVTFLPTETTKPLMLDVLDDTLDEDNENVVVTLTTTTNAFIDETRDEYTHTILDGIDPMPSVAFNVASSTAVEDAGTALVNVRLSAVSGRAVTVPFTVDVNSTAQGTDYAITTTSPITIPAGTPSVNISVSIVNDTTDDEGELLELDLGAATNATNIGQQSHQLAIIDNDDVCYGAAPYLVCLPTAATGALTLPANIVTNSSGLCASVAATPANWGMAPQNQRAACFILRDTIVVNNTTVTGNRPLVLLANTSITINGALDASSSNAAGTTGADSQSVDCDAFGQNPNGNGTGGGGGAGGTFVSVGGNGGAGNINVQAGTAAAADATPVPKLRGGCDGQRGGNGGTNNPSGAQGRGGGGLYLVSAGTISMGAAALINVSGSGGNGGDLFSGGTGGGSGGMVKLYATTFTALAGAIIMANGGGGSSGADLDTVGNNGEDPNPATPTTPAAGGPSGSAGAAGGAGFGGILAAQAGTAGLATQGGGGGGGGGGYVQSNNALTNVTVSGGIIQIP